MARRRKTNPDNRIQNSLLVQLALFLPFLFIEIGDLVRFLFRLCFSAVWTTGLIGLAITSEGLRALAHWVSEKK
ncbi:MAG: hypothetical protein AAB803_03140, partial [Patescibacteria group bacterium]